MLKALSSFARGLSDAPSGASSRSPRSRRPEPGAHWADRRIAEWPAGQANEARIRRGGHGGLP